MLYAVTAFFADSLSPITSIDSPEGPINIIPSSDTFLANEAFSDKKP